MKKQIISYEINDSFVVGQKIILTGILLQGEFSLYDTIKFEFNGKTIEREIKGIENGLKVTENEKNIGVSINSLNENETKNFINWKPNKVKAEIIQKNDLKNPRLIKIFSGIGILLSGIFSFIGFSEFYNVRIKKEIEFYPFGGEGPVPYFYKTAELYSNVNLTWGIIFLCVFSLGIWNWKKKKINEIKMIGLIFGLFILQIVHNMFEYFI
ncbi:hypothetical protein [Lutibacter maritimus]|uniref:Uncharacterized protein n=1 Tax=Lutibacter maritimus TaxID=593133 RepID=A0A1I6SYL9_9FLAO|nr:hypothetical protein [Lutibacter maritimus]SFS81967.1 hypothetical protein SAMN04488006_0204 [Lutibacter maritimus]